MMDYCRVPLNKTNDTTIHSGKEKAVVIVVVYMILSGFFRSGKVKCETVTAKQDIPRDMIPLCFGTELVYEMLAHIL